MSLVKNTGKGYSETKSALMGILASIWHEKFSINIDELKKIYEFDDYYFEVVRL